MGQADISVAIATFNGSTWIQDQLSSISSQSVLPDEVVVSDDQSQDDTLARVFDMAGSLPFRLVVLENTTRVGYAKNFERALEACKGRIIFLCDQDDYWFANKIRRMADVLGNTEALVAIHDLQLTDSELSIYPYTMLERLERIGYSENTHIKGCATALRRELLESALPIPETFPHDTWFHTIAARLERRVVLREPLMYYRRHEVNTSRFKPNTLNPKWLESKIYAFSARTQQRALSALSVTLSSEKSLEMDLQRLQQVREAVVRYGISNSECKTDSATGRIDNEVAELSARLQARKSKYGRGPIIGAMHRIRRSL